MGVVIGTLLRRRRGAQRPRAAVAIVLLAEGGEPLLLRDHIDVCTNTEGNKVEERHPGELGQELLSKGEAKG